jgi:kynureninase
MNAFHFESDLSFAEQLDRENTLGKFREYFLIPPHQDKKQIYFLGNSLGLQPKQAKDAVLEIIQQWADYGVEAFFHGENPWMNYSDLLKKHLTEIVGAQANELVVMNQLSINLHLMLTTFYEPTKLRNKIICEAKAFPSDQYVLETHVKQRGLDPATTIIEVHPREGEHCIRHEDIIATIQQHADELALVLWGGVNYYTGQVFDMPAITQAVHLAGAIAGFDLAHAAGNVEIKLHEWNVDFACWCNYKYLNSGPTTVAGVSIHERHHHKSLNRFAGWWGYEKSTRFEMKKNFIPEPGADGWQLSAPPMLLCALHKVSLEIFAEAGMENLISKGYLLAEYLMYLLKEYPGYFEIITPAQHGCQVSILFHENGKEIYNRLMEEGIIIDWREPGVIRVAPVPLYNTFSEIWYFVSALRKIIAHIA